MEKKDSIEKSMENHPTAEKLGEETLNVQKEDNKEQRNVVETLDVKKEDKVEHPTEVETLDVQKGDKVEQPREVEAINISKDGLNIENNKGQEDSKDKMNESCQLEPETHDETNKVAKESFGEEEAAEPVFDGTEVPGMEANRSTSTRSLDLAPETQVYAWPEKAVALTNFVKEKSTVAVSTVLRRLSGRKDEIGQDVPDDEHKNDSDGHNVEAGTDSAKESEVKEISQKTPERSSWNPLSYIMMSRDDPENKGDGEEEVIEEAPPTIPMKGRIIIYTRLGCQDCKEVRLFLHWKRLSYVEINIDVYPGRKLELEKISGSSAVPKVFFNEVLIGGLSELKALGDSDKLDEKINDLISEAPSVEAPSPPLSGEDDVSNSGTIDELAVIVRKMREAIVFKDRFYKMRRFTNCFIGSEAVDFISEDQYLEREEAIEFARKLASNLFIQHVLDENLFEDGNHPYRLLDHDPIVMSQCHNIPRGIIDVKPKPIVEISSRLRFLSYAIFEAYTSPDGMHVDYRSIHGSEEFARYLRTVEELQRVDLQDMPREEKLAFFINLYNMMTIHAILVWGHPVGALERRKLFGDFKYVVGGCTYSLSAIQNGILRANQRPPYNLIKPFGTKDKRSKVALPYPEPLIHFALVCGTRSGPALRCYSPGNIDKELMESGRNFLRGGGLSIDPSAKVVYVSKILKWFSIDFGKNEVEVLKHASNYLEPADSEVLLELLAKAQLKVIYQPYSWGLNN